MRTRRSNKAQEGDSGLDNLLRSLHENDTPTLGGDGTAAPETLADASRHTVGQLLDRVGSKRKKRLGASTGTTIEGLSRGRASQKNTSEVVCGMRARTTQELEQTQQHEEPSTSQPASASACQPSERQEDNDSHVPVEEALDWEDGDVGAGVGRADDTTPQKEWSGKVTFDADGSPAEELDKKLKKSPPLRRANANDKEFSVQVHMAHLLCVLARGRMVSQSCDDSLLQASLVSVLPPRLLPSAHSDRVTIGRLEHLGSWFQNHFRLLVSDEGSSRLRKEDGEALETRLPEVLQKQCGSAEELAALSVALFRGLGYVCRYVTVLDVASIKPDAESLEASVDFDPSAPFHHSRIGPLFQFELRQQVAELSRVLARRGPQVFISTPSSVDGVQAMKPGDIKSPANGTGQGQSRGSGPGPGPGRGRGRGKGKNVDDKSPSGNARGKTVDQAGASTPSKKGRRRTPHADENVKNGEGSKTPVLSKGTASSEHAGRSNSKRKGDEEFEAQIAMALAATAAAAKAEGTPTSEKEENNVKGLRKVGTSGSVWSWKIGPLLHWAEVYCGGEGSNGRWVHVDATRGIVDGADQVEGATAACRNPLRYVVAFAGAGAKDVTRRYVNLWSSIEPLRVDSEWWESTMRPLKQLEADATSGPPVQPPHSVPLHTSLDEVKHPDATANGQEDLPQFTPRADREDMELDTKLYTEPLPTNQQAYRTHHLYVLERWLKKYETVYPKGPVLGYCSGQPVYRRNSVQTLHTSDRWLREGRKVKPGELPAKIVKSRAIPKQSAGEAEDSVREESKKEVIMAELFGEWQTEEYRLPRAVGGIVPRNERGQVDVWSEKCLPPGTIHLRFPRLVPVCERLGVDYAPAMVGFEIRRGHSVPVFEGLVICEEFKDAIMEAYHEYEDQRAAQLLKKREEQAATRWRQLLLSVATRKRLRDTYQGDPAEAATFTSNKRLSVEAVAETIGESAMDSTIQSGRENSHSQPSAAAAAAAADPAHVHHYVETSESYDAETGITTKWCQCGSMIQVEEM